MVLSFLLAAAAQAGTGAYDLTIVAQSGQGGIDSIKQNVSINDSGLLAFVGKTANGLSVFVGDGKSSPWIVTSLPTAGGVDPFLQINNAGKVIVERGPFPPVTSDPVIWYDPILGPTLVSPGLSDVFSFVQLYDISSPNTQQLVAQSDWRLLNYVNYMNYTKIGPFSYLGPAVSVNNVGGTAFVADTGVGFNSSYVLAVPGASSGFLTVPSWILAQPMIADTGEVIVKAGPAASDPIMLYSQGLSSSTAVASTAMGFTGLGTAPGISDDGQYIAFYGDLNAAGAVNFQTTPGPGIFLAGRTPGGFSTWRIAGLNAADGTALFGAFDGRQRVGVNRQSQDQNVLVAFAGANASGVKGIWAARFDPGNPTDIPLVKVVLQSDQLGGSGPWDDFCLADPINTQGQVACWASSGTRQAVFRVTQPLVEIDTLDAGNKRADHTDMFVTDPKAAATNAPADRDAIVPRLILRRGSTNDIALKVPTTLFPALQVSGFTAKDLADTSTYIAIPITQGTLPFDKWAAAPTGTPTVAGGVTEVRYRLSIPVNAPVGEYEFALSYHTASEPNSQSEQAFPEPVVLLFNPWEGYDGARDQVWLDNEAERDEYIVKENGLIHTMGSKTLAPGAAVKVEMKTSWYYDQFTSPYCLNVLLKLLRALSPSQRRDADVLSEELARRCRFFPEHPADGGILEAKWAPNDADYKPYSNPAVWKSSAEILRAYAAGPGPVRYGQCWVFGGLLTSLLRAAGIPSRPITNFESADCADDDYEGKPDTTVDYYSYQGREVIWNEKTSQCQFEDGFTTDVPRCRKDGLWDFHVWCDAWMLRHGSNAPEWQALDATYEIGPAAQSDVRGTKTGVPYDVDFVRSEVAAPIWRWIWEKDAQGNWNPRKPADSTPGNPNPDSKRVGYKILTFGPGFVELNILKLYKQTPTSARSPEVLSAWDVEFQAPAAVSLGEEVSYTVGLINNTDLPKRFRVDLEVAVIHYTGAMVTNLASRLSLETVAAPQGITNISHTVAAAEYAGACTASQLLEARLSVTDLGSGEIILTDRRTGLAVPGLWISMPDGPFHAGEFFPLAVAWTNLLAQPLDTVTLRAGAGRGTTLGGEGTLWLSQTNVTPGEVLQLSTNLSCLVPGRYIVFGGLLGPLVSGVEESKVVQIGPELRLTINYAGKGQVALGFPALAGRQYLLESSGTIPSGDWAILGAEIVGDGTNKSVLVQTQGQQRFYRVRALPQ